MDLFASLPWRISDPSTLDIGTNFIKEENITKSYVYNNNFEPYNFEFETTRATFKNNARPNVKLPKYTKNSRLNKSQQLFCLKALELFQSDNTLTEKDQQIINTYNNLKIHINEENILFLKYVEDKWKQTLYNRTSKLLKRMEIFGKERWKQKLKSIKNYDRFFKSQVMIPLSVKDNDVQMIHERCLLELGTVAKLNLFYLDKNTKISLNNIPSLNADVPSDSVLRCTKLPVSQDVHAKLLAEMSNCDIVITSSGLKTIFDNTGPDYNISWDIPIVVKEHDRNGEKRRIVYLDKTLPKANVTLVDLNVKCRKTLLKTNLCKTSLRCFETPEIFVKNYFDCTNFKKPTVEVNDEKPECSTPKKQKLLPIIDDSPSKRITRSASKLINIPESTNSEENSSEDALVISEQNNEDIKTNFNVKEKSKNLNELDSTFEDIKETKKKKGKIQMHHNVTYRTWILKPNDVQHSLLKGCTQKKEIQILIRCKTDANKVEENHPCTPVTLVPKLEFQWEFGGEVMTKSELSREWITLYTRPFSNLLRIRMNGTNQECIKVENMNLNKVTNECLRHYNFVPSIGLSILYNLLSHTINLEPGNYLLHHTPKDGPFVTLMKSAENSQTDYLDLHSLYNEQNCKIENTSKWHPIDTQLIFPLHRKLGIMPGMFPPQNNKSWKFSGKTQYKNKSTKKKKKRKQKTTN